MRILLLFGTIFFLSCDEETPLASNRSNNQNLNISIDSQGPSIKWLKPRFDAIINTVSELDCKIEDASKVIKIELYIDSILVNLSALKTSDTTYKFNLLTLDYLDDQEILLFVKAFDEYGNFSSSDVLRVTIDNKYIYPEPIVLYPLDSLIVDSVLVGYKLKWWYSGNEFFKRYVVKKSNISSMFNSTEIFSTDDKSNISYVDFDISSSEIVYYQILVEDIFGKSTDGNVINNSANSIPPQINIQSVNYNSSSIFINWNPIAFDTYFSHRIMFSDKRDGDFVVLDDFLDSSIVYYEGLFEPYEQNWFLVESQDSIGQISRGLPYIHPKPSEPVIDSVFFDGNQFWLHWNIETDIDFSTYSIYFSENEDPLNLYKILDINSQTEDTLIHEVVNSEYFLYQIMTSDVWGLQNKGPVIEVSSFIKFIKTIDTGFSDELVSVLVNQDGHYIVLGNSYPSKNWLFKYDQFGTLISETPLNDNYDLHSIISLNDGGIIIAGNYMNMDLKSIFLMKIDSFGNEEWIKNINYETNIKSNSLLELANGEIVITGSLSENDNQNMLIIKLDDSGKELWNKNFGGSRLEEGYDIIEKDGTIVVLGTTFSGQDTDGDIWLIELDKDGNSLDSLYISIPGKQIGYSFLHSDQNEFVIGGTTSSENSGVSDALLIKINSYGELIWKYNFGGEYNDLGRSIVYSDGGWVLVGQTYSFGKGMGDLFLLKVTDLGELSWFKTMGGFSEDSAFDISIANDGGFIISGSTFKSSNKDGWLIKTDDKGNINQMNLY